MEMEDHRDRAGAKIAQPQQCLFRTQFPHFFKIIHHEIIQKGKVNIPKKFARQHCSDLISSNQNHIMTLKVPSGDMWDVELERIDDNQLWLSKGWPAFVDFYHIMNGHLLLFKYVERCLFHVLIFDTSATEIRYPFRSCNTEEEEVETVHWEELALSESETPPSRRSSSTPSSPPPPRTRSTVNGGKDVKKTYYGPRLTQAEKEIALQRANCFTSRYPYFSLVMQPSYIHRFILNVPKRFFEQHMAKNDSNAMKLYTSSAGRSTYWFAKYNCTIFNNRTDCKVTSGWKAFAKDNNLKEGDACVFELVKYVPILTFQVTIFRANQASPAVHSRRRGGRSGHDNPCIGKRKRCQDGTQKAFPSFQSTMTRTILWSSSLAVPLRVASKIFSGSGVKKTVYLEVGDKVWGVRALYYEDIRKCKITAGWTNFVRENSLEVGDNCKFELVDTKNMVMIRVTIRRRRNY